MTEAPAGSRRIAIEAFSPDVREVLRGVNALLGPGRDGWVVGGAVRDALLGRVAGDLDLAVPTGALRLGRALADGLGWSFVPLDAERGVCRIVGGRQIDIADFRGPDLGADLAGRDFTVNALAASVAELADRGMAGVEDATGGLADLEARRVRLCGPRSLAEDPVRTLRVAVLAVQPGWSVDPGVESAARAAAPSLREASAERVRDELVALVSGAAAGRGLRLLDRLGVVDVILPESAAMRATPQPAPHRFDVWEHSLRAVEAMDEIGARLDRLAPWGEELAGHLAEDLGDGLGRAGALKLAALLHDVAKPETRTEADGRVRFIGHDVIGAERARGIAGRLRLSGRATGVLGRLVAQHLRPMHLTQAGRITRRARYRFFRDLDEDARDLLLLALADAAGMDGRPPLEVWAGAGGAVLRSLMEGAAEASAVAATPPLLDGDDVMAAVGIGPGPMVGRLLAALREAQALGHIRTREEALASVRRATRPSHDTPRDGPV
jgi:poly(A) polymerase/tRNA nucleotidyltransferase (CCA-adding enzyme)